MKTLEGPVSNDVRLFDLVEVSVEQDLAAGAFSSWLHQTRNALENNTDTEVACGECTACCCSSYFIHIDVQETEALARIPAELLFDAPGRPRGSVVMGFNESGNCPMFIDDRCSIYEDRPQTCRTYDCRIFPAAGLTGDVDKLSVLHSKRWKFDYPNEQDQIEHVAVIVAARFLREHAGRLEGVVPNNSTQLAILALKVHEVFIDHDIGTGGRSTTDFISAIKAVLRS